MDPQNNIIEPTNRNHRILFIVITIILTAGVVGGSLWYVMDKQNKDQQKQIEDLNKKVEDSKKSEVKTEAKKEEVKTEDKKPETLEAGWKKYTNNELGISFNYPEKWGEVTLKSENPTVGSGFRIYFSKNSQANATIRSKDFNFGGGGRGGAYWDAPAVFTGIWDGDRPFDLSSGGDGQKLLKQNDNNLTYSYCSSFLGSAGLVSLVNLDGKIFDVMKVYYLVREPKSDGSGADLEGCQDFDKLAEPFKEEFIKFSESVKKI